MNTIMFASPIFAQQTSLPTPGNQQHTLALCGTVLHPCLPYYGAVKSFHRKIKWYLWSV
ncbi:hypothetical protein EXN66_Car016893 [Channa argus]|uniref:Uncharacterized protein n=1 Tax=Channa argus TaxID=215402 RepID=A0A6G1QF75_CHAAH|nr:hypothetical protein EXN66_Car016893 [Channa argus]